MRSHLTFLPLCLALGLMVEACGSRTDDSASVEGDTGAGAGGHRELRAPLGDFMAWTGEAHYSQAGRAVTAAGDVNGDRYDDLLVGAPGLSSGQYMAGSAYLVLGGPHLVGGALADADQVLRGEHGAGMAGFAVAGIGDVNGDRYDDIMVSEPGYGAGGILQSGTIHLVLGSPVPADLALVDADATLWGTSEGGDAGGTLAGVGDVDGDGRTDVLIGEHFADVSAKGAAYLLLGGDYPWSGSLHGAAACYTGTLNWEGVGDAVAGAGDVDGDGLDDLLLGAPFAGLSWEYTGHAYLVLGQASPADLPMSAADATFTGVLGEGAGWAVSGVGDVDGDGHDDMLVGAPMNEEIGSRAGRIALLLGGVSPADRLLDDADAIFLAEAPGDVAGLDLGRAGDVDGDGFHELLMGAMGAERGGDEAGMVYMVYGGPGLGGGSLAQAEVQLSGSLPGDNASAAAGCGDVDGDGLLDLAMGAMNATSGEEQTGAAYLVLGSQLQ